LAMADRNGRVWGSVPGLANRARVAVDATRKAIETFLAPDPDSRTPDFDGRRIEVIDGGWRLLNHEKYRAIRDEESTLEAKRKYINARRAAEKEASVGGCRSNVDRGRDNAEAESEAESKTKTLSTPKGVSPRKRGSASPEGFALFWSAFPRRTAKAAAIKAFAKLAPSSDLLDQMLQAIAKQLKWQQWVDGFIPHPATWLNGKRWEDENQPTVTAAHAQTMTVPGAASVAQTAALLAEQAEAGRRAQSPEAQAARIAAMAKVRGVSA
jgi:hypothetical protein